jgi:uncharacterized SAM-binding protein YcdF (DUF218 family)
MRRPSYFTDARSKEHGYPEKMDWLIALGTLPIIAGAGSVALDAYGTRRRRLVSRPSASGWDAIVVAGAPARPDGSASPALERRTRLGVDLWREGIAPRIAFTGGGTPVPESHAAADLARSWGVPDHAILWEDVSTSTEENAKEISARLGGGRVVVATDAYHVLRCELVFRRYFDDVVGVGAIPPLGARVKMTLREIGVLGVYAARGRLR